MVNKDLFLYDLAVVAIMKNEAPYVKEWIDYHILAGVDHFYIYDNESPDNLKEVLQPYIDAGIVTYTFYPGKCRQVESYIETFKNYRFFCRYMAFIDADEFIFPQNNKSITEVVDEILADEPFGGGISFGWVMYGSNNLETADYSKGVLERFTSHADSVQSSSVKTIANPRRINYLTTPHYMYYFQGFNDIDPSVPEYKELLNEKMVINHYQLKSREEFLMKFKNYSVDASYGNADYYNEKRFTHDRDNDVFDDSILKYRDFRRSLHLEPPQIDYERLVNALMQNLAPLLQNNPLPEFFEGKMETFLTCRALSTYLKENMIAREFGEIVEKLSLQAIHLSLLSKLSIGEAMMLLSELQNILPLNYPTVDMIRQACVEMLAQIKDTVRLSINSPQRFELWQTFNDFDKLAGLLKTFDNYEHKRRD